MVRTRIVGAAIAFVVGVVLIDVFAASVVVSPGCPRVTIVPSSRDLLHQKHLRGSLCFRIVKASLIMPDPT